MSVGTKLAHSADVRVEQHDVVSFDGTRLRCWITGSGPSLLVSNPIGIHPSFWLPVARLLDGRFSLVLWHGRGMWDSDLPSDPSAVTVADHARDMKAIAAALSLRDFGLVGYCAGAFTSCEALTDARFRPSKVMFINALMRRSSAEQVITRLITRVKDRPRARHTLFSFVWEFAPPQFRDYLEATLQEDGRLIGFLCAVQSMYEYQLATAFASSVPLAMVVAQSDRQAIRESSYAYLMQRNSPGDELREVAGAHYFIVEQPQTALDVIEGWFSDAAGDLCSATSR